ncbi:lysophospholipid acyltransferase family protein [Kineosporia sp. A_224]|uniref:lysophospholipid acyltransferase family protein n=1 Tax=Kineosporia sp. A_224 TaxID=1962180 RepID=UPI000B4AF4CD|nr:lysophospholipid acyltransferase family protein [Kineosporia sp. A_224]
MAQVIDLDGERPGRRRRSGAAAVAAGAQRATGERDSRRRRTTPLLADLDPQPLSVIPDDAPPAVDAAAPSGTPSPADAVESPAPAGPSGARRRPPRTAVAKKAAAKKAAPRPTVRPAVAAPAAASSGAPVARRMPRVRVVGEPDRLAAVTAAATAAGEAIADALAGSPRAADVEDKIAAALAFLRRRLTGDYEVDEFGFDRELTETVLLAVVRPLYKRWFRVEVRGIENIPESGGALVVANHSGAVALDSVMTQVAVHDVHPQHRFLRMLGADLVFQTPFVGEIARKGGATLAANADAERLLSAGEVVGVWPEGFKGVGKPFSERYKLQRFGRGGFVSAALRTRTPIVPCAIVGAEETYPILGNLPTVARLLGLPYFPVTPTFPLLGVLGAVPLPSKWLIEFGAPVPTDELGIGAAEDPMLVFDLTDQIRQTIQQTLYSLLVQRRSVFF